MKKIVPEKQVFQHHFPISRNNDLQKKALKSNDTQNISHPESGTQDKMSGWERGK